MSVTGAAESGRGRRRRAPTAAREREGEAFRRYYTETDLLLSAEGILKVVSIMGCLVTSGAFLGGAACGAPGLRASAGGAALAAGAALALVYAGQALGAPLAAPQAWLYTDIVASSAAGAALLLCGALALALCAPAVSSAVSGSLALLSAGPALGGAALTHARAVRRLDAALTHARAVRRLDAAPAARVAPRPPPGEQDV